MEREYLQAFCEEVYVVRAVVEAIYSHEGEADRSLDRGDIAGSAGETRAAEHLQQALEACHITLQEWEDDLEIIQVFRYEKLWQTFSLAEWKWMYDDGRWPWEVYTNL